jgi:sec-independent protein translocase protein TatA
MPVWSPGFIFNSLGAGEILLALAAALLFFGAERLPGIARTLGQAMNKMRRAANDFSSEIINEESLPPSVPDTMDQRHRTGAEGKKREG